MYNYRKGKTRYKIDKLGSLYIQGKWSSDIPTIYIGGQMEHRCHVLEQTGFTADPGHNMFDGSWFYDYPTTDKNKDKYNAENFAKNLLALLKEAEIKKVNLITNSFGGTIAAYASKDEVVNKVVAIHPPILGTPLASEHLLEMNHLLTERQQFIARVIQIIVNHAYGFQQDNAQLIDLRKVDLNKLLVVGSTLDLEKEGSVLKETYDIILKLNRAPSDGVVPFEPQAFNHYGINYLIEEKKQNHLEAGSKENIEEAYRLTLK